MPTVAHSTLTALSGGVHVPKAHSLYSKYHTNLNGGLTDPSAITAVYDPATRKLTITNTGTDIVVDGTRSTPLDEETAAHADTTGTYFFYYEAGFQSTPP